MEDKVGLTLACLNIKKLVKMMVGKTRYFIQIPQYYWIMGELSVNIVKTTRENGWLALRLKASATGRGLKAYRMVSLQHHLC